MLGRIRFETWPKVLADGRQPVVITRDRSLASDRVRVAANVADALALAQTLPGDTFFPQWRHLPWHETWRREGSDANFRYTFAILER